MTIYLFTEIVRICCGRHPGSGKLKTDVVMRLWSSRPAKGDGSSVAVCHYVRGGKVIRDGSRHADCHVRQDVACVTMKAQTPDEGRQMGGRRLCAGGRKCFLCPGVELGEVALSENG